MVTRRKGQPMKRVFSVFLVLIVVFGLLSVSALADGDPTIRVSSTEAEPGDTITVEVSLENNPGIMAFVLDVEYDETRLEKVEFSHTGLQGLWAMSENAVWVGNGNSTYAGVFLTLKFRVLEDAPSGDAVVTVTYGEGGICNYDEENVDFAVVAGGVTVPGGAGESVPEATDAPEATKAPETTKAPEVTKATEATDKPDTTDAPESTKAPEETVDPADADENKSAEEETAPAVRKENDGVPAEVGGNVASQPVDGAIEVIAEVSHTAPVLETETGRENGGSRSGILVLILLLVAVVAVLILVIIVIQVKKNSYRGRH